MKPARSRATFTLIFITALAGRSGPGVSLDANGGTPPKTSATLPKSSRAGAASQTTLSLPKDPRAVAVAAGVENAAASRGAWESVAGLRFTVNVLKGCTTDSEWSYLWDVKSGECRLSGKETSGDDCIIIFNARTRK